jgi:hypothetical protein
MVEGFRIEITAEEVIRHLDTRIQHHHDRAVECEAKVRRLETLDEETTDGDEDDALPDCWPGRAEELAQRAARHRRREVCLIFFRDHITPGEIYRLSDDDLRTLEWVPVEGRVSMAS